MASGRISTLARELLAPATEGTADCSDPLRSSLVAVIAGASSPDFRNPLAVDAIAHLQRSGLAGMTSAMLLAGVLGSTGAGSDLDPLDIGPAHLALPATAAVAPILAATRRAGDAARSVNFGCTVGARLRAATDMAKPGQGLHTVSSFGIVAAASAAGHVLGLDEDELILALCIALDRAAGFGVNNNSTDIGITHFGWAAAHGLEAAWLAQEGLSASTDIEAGLAAVLPWQAVGLADGVADVDAAQRTVYKAYPVNIYLNSLYGLLSARRVADPGAVRVTIPDIRRLAIEHPRSPRELRNSVRGVVALAMTGERSYRGFLRERIEQNWPRIEARVRQVEVEIDPARSTSLSSSSLKVSFTDGGGEQTCEVEVCRPGTWDRDQLLAMLSAGADPVARKLLHTAVGGPAAGAVSDIVDWVVRTPTS